MNNTLTNDSPTVEGLDLLRPFALKEKSLVPTLPTRWNICPLRGKLVTFTKELVARSFAFETLTSAYKVNYGGVCIKSFVDCEATNPQPPYQRGLSWARFARPRFAWSLLFVFVSNLSGLLCGEYLGLQKFYSEFVCFGTSKYSPNLTGCGSGALRTAFAGCF